MRAGVRLRRAFGIRDTSLTDPFLNIFEFAQRHTCNLVCLKTEINTTNPCQGLVTRILMVFSEFER